MRAKGFPLAGTMLDVTTAAAIACWCAVAIYLAGCSTAPSAPTAVQPASPIAGRALGGVSLAGTLSLGPCDMSVAPSMTRITLARQSALRLLQAGRITRDQARAVQSSADSARSDLDAACRSPAEFAADHAARLAAASSAATEADAIIKGVSK